MSGKRNHWLAIGLILVTGAASIALAAISLAGFGNDSDVSAASLSGGNLVIVAIGALLLVVLEYAHSTRRSAGPATLNAPARA